MVLVGRRPALVIGPDRPDVAVGTYDKHALQNCSLVSKAWLQSARYHLFYYLKVTNNGWLARSVALPFLHRSFSVAAESMQVKKFTFITRLKITLLSAYDFSDICRLISAFPCLETLVIGGHWCLRKHNPSQLPRFPGSLRSLGVGYQGSDVLEWLFSFDEQPALHTICLAFYNLKPGDEQLINGCLRTLGPTLEAISVTKDDSPFGIESLPVLDLSHNTRLRFIHFHLGPSQVSRVVGTLSQIVSQQVERVEVTLADEYGQDDTIEWDKVDEMLSAPQFSGLKKVAIGWEELQSWSHYDATLFRTRLPRCHARHILTFPDRMPSDLFRSCIPTVAITITETVCGI